ncbi:FapA family protein [Alkalihalobacillus deserti]|uniref:FapA family protein n=1 Tax=Alkalihalobacillus deserti TaxID=2879466 RepID=UPI001D14E57D|nr:FapA family protein [Alkalihalobacillus deserti]
MFIGTHEQAIRKQKEMEAEFKKTKEDQLKLAKLLKKLLAKEKEMGELVGRDKLSKLKVIHSFQVANQKIDHLTEELKLDEEDENIEEEGFIYVKRTIYQNVDVHFGKYRREISSNFQKTQISLIDSEIKINTN